MGICKVNINGVNLEYEKGTTYREIAEDFASKYSDDIIIAYANGVLRELSKEVDEDCKLEFVTTGTKMGQDVYVRGAIFMMLKAFHNVVGDDKLKKISVEHSFGQAIYCDYEAEVPLSDALMMSVKAEMDRLCELNLPIEKKSIKTTDAVTLFHGLGMYDKEKLFKFRRASTTNIYVLGGYTDYFYGYMPASTGILKYFDLRLYEDGFLLMLPSQSDTKKVAPFVDMPLFYKTQHEANEWYEKLGVDCVGALNEQISGGDIGEMILVQEALQEKRIGDIAEQIKNRRNVKFVMIAGPSSSGKTSFSHRLSIQLKTMGLKPHPIALDDYFLNREDTPKDAEGNYDFECLGAIDVEGFNRDMTDLLAGKEVSMPTYNFKTGKREYRGNTLKLNDGDILVIEGIHGLNDELSYSLPTESKFKIYISALTQLNVDEHNRIPTTTARLIRRMVRDARTRGNSAKATIAMWPSVRRGEEQNIFPFQEKADCMFNSALVYELAVLKQHAEPLLFAIGPDEPEYQEAKKLLKFLDYFLGIPSEEIPHNSIVREFIGGSVFPV